MGIQQTAEIGGKISSSAPVLPAAEINSRFQTTNSNALQTLRKATAQSLFRELHKIPNLRKIQPVEIFETATSIEDLLSQDNSKSFHKSNELSRRDLVEFKVKLSASWIFQMSSMIAEFSDMFDDSPIILMQHIKFADMYQAKNANKIINRLLAGLIPVDGIVSDYVSISHNNENFIVHRNSVKNFDVASSPLRIVGVTEHLAYWKDIRRILFADNEFTMLCRLSKDGIQKDWNPIKVADIFKQFAPDLAKQIELSSRTAMLQSASTRSGTDTDPIIAKLTLALTRYGDKLLGQIDHSLTEEHISELDLLIANLVDGAYSAERQRSAFAAIRAKIESFTDLAIEPDVDLELRESIRANFEIPLFAQTSQDTPQETKLIDFEDQIEDQNLLDVEVVAIYW